MTVSQVNSAHCFSQSTDLVNLNQNRVRNAFFDTHSQTLRIRNKEVVTNELNLFAQSFRQHRPAFPVIFGHTIFNRKDWEFSAQIFIEFNHFFVGIRFAFALHFIFSVFVEFGRSCIHSENNIFTRFVSGTFNSINNESQSFFGRFQIRSKTAFITNVSVVTGSFKVLLQGVENFSTHTNSFTDRRSANRHNHEFLNVDWVISMLTAVQNIHHRNRQNMSHRTAKVTIKRKFAFFSLSFRNSHRNGENSISTEFAFVFSAIEFNHSFINVDLVIGIKTSQSVINSVINIFNGFQNTFSAKTGFVAITKFNSFVNTGRSAGRNSGTSESTALKNNISLNGRITTRINNFSSMNIYNSTHFFLL